MPLVPFHEDQPHFGKNLLKVFHSIRRRQHDHRIVPCSTVEGERCLMPVVSTAPLESLVVELRVEIATKGSIDVPKQ